jgi:hypothetical protein
MALSALETSLLTIELTNYCRTSTVLQEIMQTAGIPAGEAAKATDVTTLMGTVLSNLFAQTAPTISP